MSIRVQRILSHLTPNKSSLLHNTSIEDMNPLFSPQSTSNLPVFKNMEFVIDGRVALVTFTRERSLNALGPAFLKDLGDVLAYLEDRGDIGCIVLTGRGRAFVAGGDIKEMAKIRNAADAVRNMKNAVWMVEKCKVPIVSAVNGFCFGGGCEVAMASDIIYASNRAIFGQPEIKLGVIPGAGGTQRLIRQVGKSKAMELCLTGGNMSAEEALNFNLVSKVLSKEALIPESLKLAKKIASMSLPIAKLCKESINMANSTTLNQGLELEQKNFHLCFGHEDQKIGMEAFIAKKKPIWKHR